MNNKVKKAGIAVGIFLGVAIVAYAITNLFVSKSVTTSFTKRSITNAEYAGIDDINITITGYAIGTEDVPTVPEEAWDYCKAIKESQ